MHSQQLLHAAFCKTHKLLCCVHRVVTFDIPGLPKYWRDTAQKMHDDSYWRERVMDYLTFPNPINTTLPHIGHLVRLELHTHGA